MRGEKFLLILLLVLLLPFNSFGTNVKHVYSIQILSTKDIKEAKEQFKRVSVYPFARVEKIGSYYTLRIGKSNSEKQLKALWKKIKKTYRGAFIRIADIVPNRIIVSNFKIMDKQGKQLKILSLPRRDKIIAKNSTSNKLDGKIKNVYSIQLLSTKDIKDVITKYRTFKEYPFARVEKIGSYYVLRVGKAKSVKQLRPLLNKIREDCRDAFIRIADIIPNRIVVSNFLNTQKLKKHQKKTKKFQIVLNQKSIFSLIPNVEFGGLEEKNKKTKKKRKEKKVKFQPYAILNLKINEVDKDAIKEQLVKHEHTLPYRDEVFSEDLTGRVNKALYIAYKNLERNKDDYLAYKQFRDLYEKYANRFQSKVSYEYLEDISRYYAQIRLKKYITDNTYIYLSHENYITTSYKHRNYKYLPAVDSSFTFGLKKLFDSRYLFIKLGARKSLETFPTLSVDYNFINQYLDSTLSLNVNQRAEESNYSFYGSSKTDIKYSADIPINSKNIVSNEISINKYYLQDFKNLGNGLNFESRYLHKYRTEYPDFSTYASISGGVYNEKLNKTGSINKILLTPNTKILPDDFIEACTGFMFGLDYMSNYEKHLRPFLDTHACYNTAYGIGYSIFSGLGGQMFDSDNLSFGIYMGRGLLSNPYTVLRLQLYYRKWF